MSTLKLKVQMKNFLVYTFVTWMRDLILGNLKTIVD